MAANMARKRSSSGASREELRRMGIRVNEPSIVRILRDHGFSPRPGRKVCFDRVQAAAKDTLWALDFS